MRKEKNVNVFYLEGNEHHPTIFLKDSDGEMFTEDITCALKSNKTSAKYIIRDYEDRYDSGDINSKTSNYESPERELKTIPLKITYEW